VQREEAKDLQEVGITSVKARKALVGSAYMDPLSAQLRFLSLFAPNGDP
jgi:hypothetical protein